MTVGVTRSVKLAPPAGGASVLVGFALCSALYFVQYALRSAPGVMVDDLAQRFGLTAVEIGTMAGSFFYTYTVFSLIAGAALDRFGARLPVLAGAILVALGGLLFAIDGAGGAYIGRLLQGAGAAFALTGAVYIAAAGMPPTRLALAVGIAQGAGMLGAWTGQVLVSVALRDWNVPWQAVWLAAAAVAGGIALCAGLTLPGSAARASSPRPGAGIAVGFAEIVQPYRIIFANPRSWLCGLCAGFMFVPTSIGDLIWRVPYYTGGLGIGYQQAVFSAAMVPLGWVIGSPLLGWVSDRIGRRKPVIIVGGLMLLAAEAAVLFAATPVASYWAVNLAFGVMSGAAMVPYSTIKETNPDAVKGCATGAMNLVVFSIVALAGSLHGWLLEGIGVLNVGDFRRIGLVGLSAVGLSILIAFLLPETGPSARPRSA